MNQRQKQVLIQKLILLSIIIIAIIAVILGVFSLLKKKDVPANTDIEENVPVTYTYTEDELIALMQRAKDDTYAELLDQMRTQYENGVNTTELLRQYFPDNIVYYDKTGYVFADILENVNKTSYLAENYITNSSGEVELIVNGETISHKGIDVSKFQGNINWEQVAQSGVEYAMIRVGYRSYGTGIIKDDEYFTRNIKGALNAGVNVGVYFFSMAVNVEEAIEEADYVLSAIQGYDVTYPIVIDVEEIANDTYRTSSLTPEELTDICIAFCERIKEAGYTPMIYANLKYFVGRLELERLNDYEKWFAYYGSSPYFPYEISMWQYSEKGSVPGIEGDVDINISYKYFH